MQKPRCQRYQHEFTVATIRSCLRNCKNVFNTDRNETLDICGMRGRTQYCRLSLDGRVYSINVVELCQWFDLESATRCLLTSFHSETLQR